MHWGARREAHPTGFPSSCFGCVAVAVVGGSELAGEWRHQQRENALAGDVDKVAAVECAGLSAERGHGVDRHRDHDVRALGIDLGVDPRDERRPARSESLLALAQLLAQALAEFRIEVTSLEGVREEDVGVAESDLDVGADQVAERLGWVRALCVASAMRSAPSLSATARRSAFPAKWR